MYDQQMWAWVKCNLRPKNWIWLSFVNSWAKFKPCPSEEKMLRIIGTTLSRSLLKEPPKITRNTGLCPANSPGPIFQLLISAKSGRGNPHTRTNCIHPYILSKEKRTWMTLPLGNAASVPHYCSQWPPDTAARDPVSAFCSSRPYGLFSGTLWDGLPFLMSHRSSSLLWNPPSTRNVSGNTATAFKLQNPIHYKRRARKKPRCSLNTLSYWFRGMLTETITDTAPQTLNGKWTKFSTVRP